MITDALTRLENVSCNQDVGVVGKSSLSMIVEKVRDLAIDKFTSAVPRPQNITVATRHSGKFPHGRWAVNLGELAIFAC